MKVYRKIVGWGLALALLAAAYGCRSANEQPSGADSLNQAEQADTATPFLPIAVTVTPSQTATVTATVTHTSSPTPTPISCQTENGWMEQHTRDDGAPLNYRIYLPPCYGKLEGMTYPVLYIIHGQTYADDQWDRLGMDETAEEMIKAREAPPFIIVMPLEDNTLADPFETMFGAHLAEELVPWIDANYATCTERACRAIGGLSRGGAWALHTGFHYWTLFSSIGLHSTPPFLNDPYRLPEWLNAIPADQLPRLWMDAGNQDWWLKYTADFEAQLVARNVPHEWYLFNGAHTEEYWSTHVKDYLTWYTQPWKERFPNLP